MSRYRLLIEYEGSQYHGWQQNAGVKTIQGEMIQACEKLFDTRKIELYGAGRTDAGVHALGQVAHLDVATELHPKTILTRLNEFLPFDINVLKLEKCDPGFHARYNAVARSYVYIISRKRSAFGKRYVWWVKEDLSVNKMQEISVLFKGFHDFSSFGAPTAEEISTKVDISYLDIRELGNQVIIHILGSHFLWMMVRRITGVLVHAGKGKLTAGEIQGFMDQYSERPSQLSAPPSGLYLQRVYYPGERFEFHPKIPVAI
jgi:tRNA pseudouridine38-40 synthase